MIRLYKYDELIVEKGRKGRQVKSKEGWREPVEVRTLQQRIAGKLCENCRDSTIWP